LFEVLNYSGAIAGNITTSVTNSTVTAINSENGANDLKEITGMSSFTTKITTSSAQELPRQMLAHLPIFTTMLCTILEQVAEIIMLSEIVM
jgi:hypothetical protein